MFRRHAQQKVEEALTDTPVVLIHGPRQAGKSTLADQFQDRTRVTLDDMVALALATRDPKGFLNAHGTPLTIDEIQRAPGLFLAIKQAVDKDRQPGRFLLTGSANVLALPKLADSLAGRMEVVDLMPLSQGEIHDQPDGFVDAVFEDDFEPKFDETTDLIDRMVTGGFPEPATRSPRRRNDWFANYVRTLLERDVKDLANIEALAQMPLLLSLLASRTGSPLNISTLATDTGIAYTTLRRYLNLLETIFLTKPIQPWALNRDKIFTKTPKLFLSDTGLLCYLNQIDAKTLERDQIRFNAVLQNFVAMELAKQCVNGEIKPWLMHLRTIRHLTVDFVLESRSRDLVGICVTPAKNLNEDDAEALRYLREVTGDRFKRGIVLYPGSDRVVLDDRITGLPISALWQTPCVV
ncbi:ATP-binding protein [soil metagenome]